MSGFKEAIFRQGTHRFLNIFKEPDSHASNQFLYKWLKELVCDIYNEHCKYFFLIILEE